MVYSKYCCFIAVVVIIDFDIVVVVANNYNNTYHTFLVPSCFLSTLLTSNHRFGEQHDLILQAIKIVIIIIIITIIINLLFANINDINKSRT